MTPERFLALLHACGADLRRWPESDRDAARSLLAGDPTLLAAHAEAALLDRDLDVHAIDAPDAALLERIVSTASVVAPRPWARAGWRLGAFWPRAGWAVTGLAGALSGALAVSIALGDGSPAASTDWQKRTTAFTDRGADWSEE